MGPGSARAQDFLNQEWLLDPGLSTVYMQTVKANSIFETHQFSVVEGSVSSGGDASIRIDLASIHSGIDIRDTRMRFQLFETFKFPYAQINAKLSKAKLRALATQTRLSYPLSFSLSLHGHAAEVQTEVWVTRVSETTVSVASIKPINLLAESFGFVANIGKLADAIEGTPIAAGASIAFDLVFKTGALKPELESKLASEQKHATEEATAPLAAEACEVRFTVVSQTGAIQFKTGSSVIEPASEPILNSVADIANRCGTIKFDINGHTDNIGDARGNQRLSLERAKAVSAYLQGKGVNADRMQATGFGGERPIKSNDTDAGRAANRRIEFEFKKE
jgi:outer membrane protein OmpA-like peptidoglycan-associated protein